MIQPLRLFAARPFTMHLGLVALVASATACDIGPNVTKATEAAVATVEFIEVDKTTTLGDKIVPPLPAYETEAEKLAPGKADAADDQRNKYRQWYAQTVPPKAGAFRPFGEWEEMKEVWTTYSNSIPGTPAVRRMFARQTINFVRHSEPKVTAYVIVNAQNIGDNFLSALDKYGITADEKKRVKIVKMDNQTIWHIDYGPFPIVEKKTKTIAFTDFMYYGGRYIDDAIPARIAHEVHKDITTFKMPFPFEGGNIQADGHGMCMTSMRALNNTGYKAIKVRNLLKKYCGCDTTIIVQDISDDGTGHIDMFFKWISADHVMFGKYEKEITLDYDGDGKTETLKMPSSITGYKQVYELNQKRMDDNSKVVAALTSPVTGKKIKVSRLSMMTALRDGGGSTGHLPRTFINSTFTNGVNVYPSYSPKSCRDAAGSKCMVDKDCADKEHCSAGKCTKNTYNNGKLRLGSAVGCDEIEKCKSGQECAVDPLKVALRAQVQKQWEAAMPNTKHVGLYADRIALWSGAIHCITRTVPNLPYKKIVPDGLCLKGTCGCAKDGYDGSCDSDQGCYGPKLICNCNRCWGTCKGGATKCTDDSDCSTDGKTVVEGSCRIDRDQKCKGEGGSTGSGCGSLAWEGWCDGKVLKYCKAGSAKQVTCPKCCGWDASEGSYNCLSTSACGGAVQECAKEGNKGCSVQSSHAWECKKEGDRLVRKWTHCDGGKTCGSGACFDPNSGTKPTCPAGWGTDKDAGSTESDAGSSSGGTSSGGGADGGPAGIDGGTGSSGGGTKTPPGGDDDGCTAARTSHNGGPFGWFVLVFGALGLVISRRRRAL